MAHKVVKPPKKIIPEYSEKCELHGVTEGDVSPCSHFDHCERSAVIWVYDRDGGPRCYGLCQQCYDFSLPCSDRVYWYRVVKLSPEFNGVL